MKKTLFILAVCLVICNNIAKAQDEMGLMISTGYKHLSNVNLPNSHDAFTVDLTLHNYFNNIDFNSSFNYGKNYISFEPCSLIGLLYYQFAKGEEGHSERDMGAMILLAMACSTMSFNIHVDDEDKFIIRPYWSLMRISKVKDAIKIDAPHVKNITNGFELNAALGAYLSINFDPFVINPFCEYGFGYNKNSPFTGFNFGLSVGIKLYE
ncbi:MAG: hypothetical protein LBK94_04895 [Prevotellaceae bacterium]|jgi:hypothetical protein|nr:hypothetical protein [Prevotellaceae bacterium]